MEIKEICLGSYEITENKKIIGKIEKKGNKYKITKDGKNAGYIVLKEVIQNYDAFDKNGCELGTGVFEEMLSLFFK